MASPTLSPTFAWLREAHLGMTHPLKTMPTAILFQDDSDVVARRALEMHRVCQTGFRSAAAHQIFAEGLFL